MNLWVEIDRSFNTTVESPFLATILSRCKALGRAVSDTKEENALRFTSHTFGGGPKKTQEKMVNSPTNMVNDTYIYIYNYI